MIHFADKRARMALALLFAAFLLSFAFWGASLAESGYAGLAALRLDRLMTNYSVRSTDEDAFVLGTLLSCRALGGGMCCGL